MFFGKNGKLESPNKKPKRLLFTSSRAGRMRKYASTISRPKVVWDAVATLASLSGYMAHVALD